MSDLRDELRKAGLISDKQARQAKHKERMHATEVGHDGLTEEKRREQEQRRSERQAQREADRRREKERAKKKNGAPDQKLQQVIRSGWIRDATIGSRRFFFTTRTSKITYLDLSEPAARRLIAGKAAIVETEGATHGRFCVVTDSAATVIRQLSGLLVRFYNVEG
jgi:hypothetical protein